MRGKLTRMWAHVAGIALVAGARVPDAECGSSPKRCFPLRQAHKTHQLLSFPSPVAQTWFAPTAPGSGKTHRLAGSRFPLCSSPLCGGPAGFQPAPGDHTHGDEPHVRKKKEERGEGASPVHTRRASCFGKGSPWRRARTRRLQAESNGQAEASRASARARHSRPPALQSANYARHRFCIAAAFCVGFRAVLFIRQEVVLLHRPVRANRPPPRWKDTWRRHPALASAPETALLPKELRTSCFHPVERILVRALAGGVALGAWRV